MSWAVFETDDGVIHVAPVSEADNNEMMPPHVASENCPCHPWYDDKRAAHGTKPLLIHEQLQ